MQRILRCRALRSASKILLMTIHLYDLEYTSYRELSEITGIREEVIDWSLLELEGYELIKMELYEDHEVEIERCDLDTNETIIRSELEWAPPEIEYKEGNVVNMTKWVFKNYY